MSPKTDLPTPPAHLSAESRAWWSGVVEAFVLESHHLRLLTLAAEAWDRCQQARKALTKGGLTYLDRFKQPHARPELKVEADSRIAFARLLRELGLDISPPAETRPPRTAGRGR